MAHVSRESSATVQGLALRVEAWSKTEIEWVLPGCVSKPRTAVNLSSEPCKEVDGALTALGMVLPIKDRMIRLINHPATAAYVPLATLRNIRGAVHDVGKAMDKENDVLVLFMTSHGDRKGLALQLPNKIVDLTPQDVATAFKREGIKNRVVIVSACFSGIFVSPLQDPNTIVLTAADATHTSFGCAPERDWTYFGDAFFRQSVQFGTDFQDAFRHAQILRAGS